MRPLKRKDLPGDNIIVNGGDAGCQNDCHQGLYVGDNAQSRIGAKLAPFATSSDEHLMLQFTTFIRACCVDKCV